MEQSTMWEKIETLLWVLVTSLYMIKTFFFRTKVIYSFCQTFCQTINWHGQLTINWYGQFDHQLLIWPIDHQLIRSIWPSITDMANWPSTDTVNWPSTDMANWPSTDLVNWPSTDTSIDNQLIRSIDHQLIQSIDHHLIRSIDRLLVTVSHRPHVWPTSLRQKMRSNYI